MMIQSQEFSETTCNLAMFLPGIDKYETPMNSEMSLFLYRGGQPCREWQRNLSMEWPQISIMITRMRNWILCSRVQLLDHGMFFLHKIPSVFDDGKHRCRSHLNYHVQVPGKRVNTSWNIIERMHRHAINDLWLDQTADITASPI